MSDEFTAAMDHSDLVELFPDVYWMQGRVRMGPGMVINRVMTVLRHQGELTIINAVRPQADKVAQLDALGTVKNVVKIGTHGMDDAWYRHHYGARQWAAPGVETQVDQELTPDGPQPLPWLRTIAFEHTKSPELALVADRHGGILITCDSVQNWPDLEGCSLLAKGVTKLMGFDKRPANIGPPWMKGQTQAGGSLRPDFERLLEVSFDHLIGGHGKPLEGGAHEALSQTVTAVFG